MRKAAFAVVRKSLTCGAATIALICGGKAFAQDETDCYNKEIIVNGTLVRGIAPARTNVVGVSSEGIRASSATTVTELLADTK